MTRCGAWGGLGGHPKVPLHIAAVDMWSFEFANGFFFNAVVRPKCGKSMVINRMPMVPFGLEFPEGTRTRRRRVPRM